MGGTTRLGGQCRVEWDRGGRRYRRSFRATQSWVKAFAGSIRGSGSRQSGAGFRPDIQGLRAIAVLLVALNHAGVARLSGGYVGVDVFFVISGFLITGWLMKRTRGRARAFRRVLRGPRPAHSSSGDVDLGCDCCRFVLPLELVRALSTLDDCVWAAFFAANVHFAQVGTDYFARANPPSPVQQFWTLAVEEQFYLVWPALLAAAIWVVGFEAWSDARFRV